MQSRFLVNRNVKAFMVRNDKKSSAVADRAGIRRDVFSRIVNSRRPVYADEVLPICKALGVSVEELFREDTPN